MGLWLKHICWNLTRIACTPYFLDFIQHLINFTYLRFISKLRKVEWRPKLSWNFQNIAHFISIGPIYGGFSVFFGYKELRIPSFVTGLLIRKYDTKAPFNRNIPYFQSFSSPLPSPRYLNTILSLQHMKKVIELLKINGAPILLGKTLHSRQPCIGLKIYKRPHIPTKAIMCILRWCVTH